MSLWPPPLAHCQKAEREQAERRRNPEDKVCRHQIAPLLDNRVPASFDCDIRGIRRQLSVRDQAIDVVDGGTLSHQPPLRHPRNRVHQELVTYGSPIRARRFGIAGQLRSVFANQDGTIVCAATEHLAIEIAEIGGRDTDEDDTGKTARIIAPAGGNREYICTGEPAEYDAAEIERQMRIPQRLEIFAVAEVNSVIHRIARGSHQGLAGTPDYDDRRHLGEACDHRPEPVMKLLLAGDDRVIAQTADKVIHPAA